MHNFPTHFWRKLQSYKDRTAVVGVDERGKAVEQTYWEWTRRLQRLAIALLDANFEPGTRIGMLAPSGKDWLDLAVASWLVGGCVVPIVGGQGRTATLRALARTGAEWLVVGDADEYWRLRGPEGKIPDHLHWIAVGGAEFPAGRRFFELDELDARGRSLAVRGHVDVLAKAIYGLDIDQPTLVLFDKELTSDPHGAYYTGDKLGEMLDLLGEDLQLAADDRLAVTLEYGCMEAWLLTVATLLQGAQIAIADRPKDVRNHIAQLAPTRLVCGPEFLDDRAQKLRDQLEESPEGLAADGGGSERGLGTLLGRVGKEVARKFFYDPLDQQFGGKLDAAYLVGGELSDDVTAVIDRTDLTLLGLYARPECGISHIERPGARRRGSQGRPVQGYACKIAGAKRGRVGEVLVRSDFIFDGYWDGEGPLAVDADGWLHTGDRGRIESGYLFLSE
ncbi:MAG: AMP-binding protein [Persicimonas sp.]